VFAAETWYIDQEQHLHFPLTLASTYPSKVYPGRQHHGLLCLCSPSLWPLVSQIRVSEFSISISLLGHTVLGVYTPPGLPCPRFTTALTGWSTPSVIVGDINVRFGPSWGDTRSGPADRLLACGQVSALFHLQHLRPASGFARTDHVFIKHGLDPRLVICDAPFSTDHRLLQLSLSIPLGSSSSPSEGLTGLRRYYLKYLDDPGVVGQMLALYQCFAPGLDSLLHSFLGGLGGLQPDARQEAVDQTEQVLVDAVSLIAEECLGSYEVAEARRRPDRMHLMIGKAASVADATRLYKRAFRTQGTQVWIRSRDPSRTPLQDAISFYSEVFAQPNPAWQPDNLVGDHFFAVGDVEISTLFTADLVRKLISRYPCGKSCGSDSV